MPPAEKPAKQNPGEHLTDGAVLLVCITQGFLPGAFVIIGPWLSLVERLVRDEEAAGSNPAGPRYWNVFRALWRDKWPEPR